MILLNALHRLASMAGGGEGEAHHEGDEVGADFIMHHIQDSPQVELPFIGHIDLPELHFMGIDISITKHVFFMWVAAAILIIMLPLVLRSRGLVPRGAANMIEAIVVFIRDEIALPAMGKDGHRFMPFLLTIFFFVLVCNFLGMIPMGATPTGNIGVTAALALITFVTTQAAGMMRNGVFGYLKGLVPPKMPIALLPIMIPVEILGLLTKPFALAIRLFANMTAGHIVIFALLSLIFIFKSWFVAPLPALGVVVIGLLEVLIALIQAYIFTLLSAVFIGMAIHQDH